MTRCSIELRVQGYGNPIPCEECGLGPCTRKRIEPTDRVPKHHFAAAKAMIEYWRDYMVIPMPADPTEDDLVLIRRIERILNGHAEE